MGAVLEVERYKPEMREEWDAFVDASAGATFQQSRRFLGYHKARFEDLSFAFRHKGKLCGILPAARHPKRRSLVVCHPGAAFGGLVWQSSIQPAMIGQALDMAMCDWQKNGCDELSFKGTPRPVVATNAASELASYWLWRWGASVERVDIWNYVDLARPLTPSKGLKDNLRIARKADLVVEPLLDGASLAPFHQLVVECLGDRHGASPVHTLAELTDLVERLGGRQCIWIATIEHQIMAATWMFHYGQTHHTQYIASTPEGRRNGAPGAMLAACAESAQKAGVRTFSFGASTAEGGLVLNDGLYRFKASFGGDAVQHQHLRISVNGERPVAS